MQASLKLPRSLALPLADLVRRAAHMEPVTSAISERWRGSVVRNFDVGGRYDRAGSLMGGGTPWKPVAGNPTPLVRTGMLRDSIHSRFTHDTALVATGLEYAAIHNNGGQIRSYARSELFVRNRAVGGRFQAGTTAGRGQAYGESSRRMPPRPFMVIQPSDLKQARELARAYLLGAGVK